MSMWTFPEKILKVFFLRGSDVLCLRRVVDGAAQAEWDSDKGFDDGGDHNNGLLHLSEEFVANDEVQPATTHFVNNFIKVSRRDSI